METRNVRIALICLLLFSACDSTDDYTTINSHVVRAAKDSLFIITQNWGLNGDNQTTIITKNVRSNGKYDGTTNIVYDGLEPFVYKVEKDTLFIFSRHVVAIPKGFTSKIPIIQTQVDNPKFVDLTIAISKKTDTSYKAP